MSNGSSGKKKTTPKKSNKRPRYHQIPDDLPPKEIENSTHKGIRRTREWWVKAYSKEKVPYGPIELKARKAAKAVKKQITNVTDPIAKKRAAARKKRETDARAQRDADLLRGMDTVKKQKKKSGQGG